MRRTMDTAGNSSSFFFRLTYLALTICSGMLWVTSVQAFEVDTGDPDTTVRFDNTLRYNAGWRVANRNHGIANNPAYDEGDYRFGNGDMVTNRVDLFSELDYGYQKRLGFRVSTALWYDSLYDGRDRNNPALPGTNYPGNRYTDYVKRFYAGPSGEILDAFVWGNFKPFDTDLSLKLGRHAVLWGEASFGTASANSVAVDMAPQDATKQTISPGSTAKETTLPIHQLTGTWQLTDSWSVSGQYTYQWRSSRVPEGGTFFGSADAILYGPPLVNGPGNYAAPPALNIPIQRVDMRKGDSGDKGIAIQWRPQSIEGNFGLYYRRYAAKTPIWAANTFVIAAPATLGALAVYPGDISLWGASFGSTIMGTAVGAEISHRHNTPLIMNPASMTSAALGFEGPRGDTWHALLNTTTLFNQTDYWSNATLVLELSYQKLDKVTSNPDMYKSLHYTLIPTNSAAVQASCTGDKIVKGCATDDAYHLAMLFQPVWTQVFPQVDLTGNFVFQQGIKGNAPTGGINEGASVLSLGLQADYAIVNRFSLTYTNFWGKAKYFGAPPSKAGPVQTLNGANAVLGDRDNVIFTYSRTF